MSLVFISLLCFSLTSTLSWSSRSEGELRKRHTSNSKNLGERAEVYVEAISAAAPEGVKPYLQKAKPFVGKVGSAVEAMIPILMSLYEKAMVLKKQLEPFHVDLLLPSFFGLIMCFFGGSYMTLIAAVEAYRMVGWESSYKCLCSLYEDFNALKDANEKVSFLVLFTPYRCYNSVTRMMLSMRMGTELLMCFRYLPRNSCSGSCYSS